MSSGISHGDFSLEEQLEKQSVPWWIGIVALFLFCLPVAVLFGVISMIQWIDSISGWKSAFFILITLFFGWKIFQRISFFRRLW